MQLAIEAQALTKRFRKLHSYRDLVLYPWFGGYVKRIAFRKPESQVMGLVPAPIAAWAKRIEALPNFEKTIPEHWREGWGKEPK